MWEGWINTAERATVRVWDKDITGQRIAVIHSQMDFESMKLAASEAKGGWKMSMKENKEWEISSAHQEVAL